MTHPGFILRMLNLADALLTVWVVCVAKIGEEANPAMAWLIGISPFVFIIVKILVVAFGSVMLTLRGHVKTLWALVVLYIAAVASNLALIGRSG